MPNPEMPNPEMPNPEALERSNRDLAGFAALHRQGNAREIRRRAVDGLCEQGDLDRLRRMPACKDMIEGRRAFLDKRAPRWTGS